MAKIHVHLEPRQLDVLVTGFKLAVDICDAMGIADDVGDPLVEVHRAELEEARELLAFLRDVQSLPRD